MVKRIDKSDISDALSGLYGERKPEGILTGLTDLDRCLCGLREGDLIVVGGRPSMGKTAFALSLVKNIAINDKVPTLYLSWGMDKEWVLKRLICLKAGMFSPHKRANDEERRRLEEAGEEVLKGNLYISDLREITPDNLEQTLSELELPPKLIIIDYLQMVAYGMKKGEMKERIRDYLYELKKIGLKYRCTILVLSALSKKPDKRKDHRPFLKDLRGIEAIEAVADAVLFLYRDCYYNWEAANPDEAEVIVTWNRRGPWETVKLTFSEGEFLNFNPKKAASKEVMHEVDDLPFY